MIEITDEKYSCLSEDIEKSLKYLGKAMQCLDGLKEEKYGKERYGYREDSEEREHRREHSGRYDRY